MYIQIKYFALSFVFCAIGFPACATAETYTVIQSVKVTISNNKASNSEMVKQCREAPAIKPQIQIMEKLKVKEPIKFVSNGNVGLCKVEYTFPDLGSLCSEHKVFGSDAFSDSPKVDDKGYPNSFLGLVRVFNNGKMVSQTTFDDVCNAPVKIKI